MVRREGGWRGGRLIMRIEKRTPFFILSSGILDAKVKSDKK